MSERQESEEKLARLLDEAIAIGVVREERIIAYHAAMTRAIDLLETGRAMAALRVLRDATMVRSVR